MTNFLNNEIFQLFFKVFWSFLFNNFIFFFNTNTHTSNLQTISNNEQIDNLMSNCNENDVRLRYLYLVPKNEVSIVAFNNNGSLVTKKANGYEFGNIINGNVESPEDAIPDFPSGFSEDYLNMEKMTSAFLILVFIFFYGSRNRYKRDLSITIFSSIILLIRSFLWKRYFALRRF